MINPTDDRPFTFKTVFNDALTVTCSNENNYMEIKTCVNKYPLVAHSMHAYKMQIEYTHLHIFMHTYIQTYMFYIL